MTDSHSDTIAKHKISLHKKEVRLCVRHAINHLKGLTLQQKRSKLEKEECNTVDAVFAVE